MKTTICIGLILISFATSAQKAFSVRAGTAYSSLKDVSISVKDGLGYYFGVGYTDVVTPAMSFASDLSFINQHSKIEDVDFSVRSMNLFIGTKIHPWQEGVIFIVGLQPGYTTAISADGDKLDLDRDFQFSTVSGVGYQKEKFGIEARYVGAVDDQQQGYDYNIQLGLTMKF